MMDVEHFYKTMKGMEGSIEGTFIRKPPSRNTHLNFGEALLRKEKGGIVRIYLPNGRVYVFYPQKETFQPL